MKAPEEQIDVYSDDAQCSSVRYLNFFRPSRVVIGQIYLLF